ncbi:LamG domain-containing protein [Streptomyces chrestomyceticus]|uniref:LamG domain-containing protein n=1 Tax=Streptomyces chrestomyceticus TaxID=68185 RepID=A0ABU7X7V1_9ACTN
MAGGGAELGVPGKVGTALRLNGTTAYAATAGPVVDTTKSFSVSAWVKLDDKDRNYTFLSQAGDRASGFQLYYSKYYDKWVFNRHAKDTDDTQIVRSTSTDAAQAGVWTQLTGVYDAAAKQIQLFVNGKPQPATEFTTPWRAAGGLQIGRLAFNRHAKAADDTHIVRSTSTDAAQAGVWTQLTGVYDAAAKQIQLFVNGKPQPATEFTTPWRAAGGLQIGRLHYKGAWQENAAGSIDSVRVWDRAVAAAESINDGIQVTG